MMLIFVNGIASRDYAGMLAIAELCALFQSWTFPGFMYRGADMSLARPGRKQATATEDFEFHISYL